MNKQNLTSRIQAANKFKKADLVIRNARIVNVFTRQLMAGDVAIVDGVIVGIGEYEGIEELDAAGRFLSPGLIDAHVHIESSMVTPHQFSEVILPHGVTTVITDPHEIANVCGTAGLDFMLEDSADTMLEVLFMLPSCVPATSFENSGAALGADDLRPYFEHPRVLGLAEVMDFPAVLNAKSAMLDKLLLSKQIDGHAAGLSPNDINVYKTAGISTDHECTTKEEALARIERGMYVMLREGSVAKDLKALLDVVTEQNAARFLFCTDDKHLDDLLEEGSIDFNIRIAINHGLHPITAISMGSFHTAQCYGLSSKGAIAPGYDADFILLDRLEDFVISEVYKAGKLASKGAQYVGTTSNRINSPKVVNTVHMPHLTPESLRIPLSNGAMAHVIGIQPNSLLTEHLIEKVPHHAGTFTIDVERDLLKVAVIERHKALGTVGLGIVKGLGLKRGAIATTVAHDSHNIIAAGTNDEDILLAAKVMQEMGGGLAIVDNGEILATLPLAIAGLMSVAAYEDVNLQLKDIEEGLLEIGAPSHFNAFLTLSFLSLPVIPDLKLTDRGLFDVASFKHIPVAVEE